MLRREDEKATDAAAGRRAGARSGVATALAVTAVLVVAALRGSGGEERREAQSALQRKAPEAPLPAGFPPPQPASHPAQIPAAGWKSILWRTFDGFSRDRILLVSAGVTFYLLLAIFPAISALVALYGFFADRATLTQQTALLQGVLPEGGVELLRDETARIAASGQSALSVAFLVGLAVSIWSANAGMKGLFEAMNVVYEEEEKRSFLRLNLQSLGFTFAALLFALFALGAIIVAPLVLNYFGLQTIGAALVAAARWPLLYFGLVLALAVLYRYGPSRDPTARWRWITWGSSSASALWLVVSILFSWYVAHFGSYNATYGSLGAVIGFMTWIWLSITVVLLGGELNSQIERQAGRKATPD
ncbi:YihY/virulence factor BrkB family protein [Methylocella sp.]|uniref:YihY/virulence factor BrkB family protein n=1 Tax=Methylocella sp. TaxID=1978226 RepID=UPI00378305C7